jgi:hypothetical protein
MSILLDLGLEDMQPERNMAPTNSATIVVRISYSSLAPPIFHKIIFSIKPIIKSKANMDISRLFPFRQVPQL